MKSRRWILVAGVCLVLGGATVGKAAVYYVDDDSNAGDVYTALDRTGSDLNDGLTTNTPKRTLASVLTNAMAPGDVIYIDTGTYAPASIPATVIGSAASRIVFQGSTNLASGGTTFTGGGSVLDVRGRYLNLRDLRIVGGNFGLHLNASSFGEYERIACVSNVSQSMRLEGTSNSNAFRRCSMMALNFGSFMAFAPATNNYLENCIGVSRQNVSLTPADGTVSNMVGCIMVGKAGISEVGYLPARASRNLFFVSDTTNAAVRPLSDFMLVYTNWRGNAFADPKFANADAGDFQLLSAAGFVSNGVWVTNPAVGYSPAIDFGRIDDPAYADEPEPNGGRVNIGLNGGTVNASKSRTNEWLFAMTYNDGGTLIQTGRLEWTSGNLGTGATVDLQYSTNGTSWVDIATAVLATNESHAWAPDFSHPAVLWRVRSSTNAAVASTNARAFSVRMATNTVFNFYVNDGNTGNDVYCSELGDNAQNGAASNAPKRSLQAILDAYALRGGDTVYVDTGNYQTNFTTVISCFDGGSQGNPVRIRGSAKGSVFGRISSTADTLAFQSPSVGGIPYGWVDLEHLQLNSGRYGLYLASGSNFMFRNMQFSGNQWGVYLGGNMSGLRFEQCLAVSNVVGALYAEAGTIRDNQWLNGVMWGNPTILSALTNTALTVSNSILGNATVLFGAGSQVVTGDCNVVWSTGVGLGYSPFSALQNAGAWTRSVYADPLFANAGAGDYHLKSVMGRFDTNTLTFTTNDLVHSPAIDFGNPAASVGAEPPPNGSRLNAGVFGGTEQASKSRTNAWLQVISYTDGGTLDAQAGSWLRWTGSAFDPTSTVTIWLSRDSGGGWEILATNVSATNGAYFFSTSSTNDSSSSNALWRISLDGAVPAVSNQTAVDFTYKNGAYIYYVNDSSTNGDIYCTAPGNNANLGLSANAPKADLHDVISKNQLGPGDRVYVDTGSYVATGTVVMTSSRSGAATNPIVIFGSTNRVAGGSVIGQPGPVPAGLGLVFQPNSSNIVVRDLVFSNLLRGVAMTNALNITLDGVEVRGATQRAFDLQGNTRNAILRGCVAHGGAIGAYLNQATNISITNSVFWQNGTAALYLDSQVGLAMENSILASSQINATLFSVASTNGFSSDYNGIQAGPFTRVGVNRSTGAAADNLAAWQAMFPPLEARSVPGDPLLADPDQYDYHLMTEQTQGRRLPSGQLISDSVSSPLLDAGNPASDVSAEPMPNGGRVNIGRFGGTWQASIAPTTPWLKTISYGDAGKVQDGATTLRWLAGGGFSNQTVRVDVSVDGGNSWATNVASGIPATNGMAVWTVGGLPDTPAGVWRVMCLENTNWTARSTNFFAIRNGALDLFVATADTNEAVYTTGPGAATNWRATAAAPLNSLGTLFDRFDLEAGDRIWVDTGVYEEPDAVLVGMKDSGTTGNPIRVVGNVAKPYSGTILKRPGSAPGYTGIQLSYANGIHFDSLMVSNAHVGVAAENGQGLRLDRVRVGYCSTNAVLASGNAGLTLSASILEQSLSAGLQAQTGSAVKVHNCLIRDNSRTAIFMQGGDVEVKNSILEASGTQGYIYYWAGGGRLASDYNNIRAINGANVAGGNTRQPDRFLIDWQISSAFSNDISSFGYEANFHNPAALDFHLKSEFGRFDPVLGVFTTNDTVTSRLIDLGDTNFPSANEPEDNGDRINVDLYGNTAEASKSSGQVTLVPLTMSDGGTIRGDAKLYWAWNGIAGNERVNVEFSADGGTNWVLISNVYASVGSSGLEWATTNFTSTALGVWRVSSTGEPPVIGQTEVLFAVKNDPLAYYINDSSTNGDVYCSAKGLSSNTGLSSNSPLNSLETLLNRYKVEHGDTVYVDTGIYPRSSPLVTSIPSVSPTNYVVIQGSTNEAAGGTVFTNASGAVLNLQNVRKVELRDLRLHGGGPGLAFTQASENRLLRIRAVGTRGNAFDLGVQCDQNRFIQCAALNFSSTGFHVATPTAYDIAPATNSWSGGVISSIAAAPNGVAAATGALMGVQSGRIHVSNSVFVANGPEHVIFSTAAGVVRGDYNLFHRVFTNSLFARAANGAAVFGVAETLLGSVGSWAAWNSSDSNSFAADPLFADLPGGNLHPKSAGGRYNPATGSFVTDAETSPLIDAADPATDWALESPPNGGRANLGVYGGGTMASRTPTNGTFVLQTLNQGGVARGDVWLRWIARGGATNAGHIVNILISTNSGETFDTLASSPAAANQYLWTSTNQPSLPTLRWKVQSQSQSAWASASERDFAVHNTNMTFYVNDALPNNDVYCSAEGASGNTGLLPSSPVTTLAEILSRYDVEPGDVIRIDTGIYGQSAPTAIGHLDGGTVAEPVTIQGSTNSQGSVFSGAGVELVNVRGMTLKNLKFAAQSYLGDVASIVSVEDVSFENVDVLDGVRSGFSAAFSSNVVLRNVSAAGLAFYGVSSMASYNTRVEFGVLWSNKTAQVLTRNQTPTAYIPARENSFVAVSNTVLGTFGIGIPAYEIRGNLLANHNNIYRVGGGLSAVSFLTGYRREIDSVGSWAGGEFGQDAASLSHNPRFANAPGGDFHPKSSAGRFDPVVGTHVFVDPPAENSPLIDAGNPALTCTEPEPNGARVNIGRYGNTAQASLTPTNGALTLISFNDGGRASGTGVPITWLARGSASNALLTISYSADAGTTWTTLVSGVSAAAGFWIWDSTLSEQSVQARLKLEASDGSSTTSAGLFSVRNRPFVFYINDTNTANDVYCNAGGNNANSGLASNKPMADLNVLLAQYDLDSSTNGGDIVYIDTGVYKVGDPWRITQADSAGDLNLPPVVLQGSTNPVGTGTVLERTFNSIGLQADYAVGLRIRNITISNTVGTAVVFNDCYGVAAESVAVGSANVGFQLNGGSQLRIANCSVWSANQGIAAYASLAATNTVFPVIENNLLWECAENAILLSGKATVRNNILSVAPGKYVYKLGRDDVLTADYNSIWLGNGGRVFRREALPVPTIYESVGAWAAASRQDLHSFDSDPLLVNPAARDFHLKSKTVEGRFVSGTGSWTNDEVSSPLIDAGWTGSAAWTNEPEPNGRRINIGPHGGTWEASKSGTNSALYLLTLNRGGVASGQVALNWQAAGQATGHTVRLDVSVDNGATWNRIATGVPASQGGIIWSSLGLPSSPLALWSVQDEQETNVIAVSELNFVLHNGPIYYYVNDEFSAGDIYCGGALGSSTNTGISPGSPKRWVSEIVDAYNLEPGDVIHVDTGRYQVSDPTIIGDLDAGRESQSAGQQVTIQGSTNEVAGGSLYLLSDPSQVAFRLDNTYGIRFRNLSIQGASNGLSMEKSYFIAGDWLDIRGSEDGVWAHASSNIVFTHSSFAANRNAGIRFSGDNKEIVHLDSCVLWSNRYGIYLQQGYARSSNTVFGMVAPNSFAFYMQSGVPNTGFEGDYNNLFAKHPSAAVGGVQFGFGSTARTTTYATVSAWSLATGQDKRSLEQDPLLADPGNGDYHPMSPGGRYRVGTGWVTADTVSSPLIDAGNPQSLAWTAEQDPNGRRLNIGLYGGTPQASKTPPDGFVIVIYPNTGARVSGVVTMQWAAVGSATNYSGRIEYSPDDGVAIWTNIVDGVPLANGSCLWDTKTYERSARARWRITARERPSITATSGRFSLDTDGTIPYYVNDNSTNNDVYCTAVGDDANDGLSPETPKASLQAVLDAYGLAASDVVFVDAGTYVPAAPPIVINEKDSGRYDEESGSNKYVTIQGSTNPAAPTFFVAPSFSTPQVFSLQFAVNLRMKSLTIRNAAVGVDAYQTIGCEFDNVRIENNRSMGMNLLKNTGLRLVRSTLWKNSSPTGGVALAINDSAVAVENCVLWGSPTAISINSGALSVSNSVLDASGTDGRIYQFSVSASAAYGFQGDYNSYSRKNGALICEQRTTVGGSDYYNDLPRWSAVNSSDRHSMTATMTLVPEFADEVGGDFHPKSTKGRFVGTIRTNGVWTDIWTNDVVLSPLVDAGAPSLSSELEPPPNGDIVNIGAHGGTRQASMTQTNPPWLKAISYNCEGLLSGNVLLYWLHGGMSVDAPVRLEYSTDYESSWSVIASNLPAGQHEYSWNTDTLPLTLAVNWRVVAESNTNYYDASDCSLPHKPGPVDYYVNDTVTTNDVWCQGPGLPFAFGADPTNRRYPIDSLAKLFEKYPVGEGDRVYVDTGVYPVTDTSRILVDGRNLGTPENPLRIYGSTNFQAGGALLAGNGSANGFDIQNTRNIEIYGLRVSNAMNGVALMNVTGAKLEGMELFRSVTNGVWALGCGDVTLRRVRLWGNRRFGFDSAGGQGAQHLLQSVVWGNPAGAVQCDKALSVSNSILVMTNSQPVYSEFGSAASIAGDYNFFGMAANGKIATNSGETVVYPNLRAWQKKDKDLHSVVFDPLFVNPAAGDFHLQSRAGYWSNGTLKVSSNTSWAIDAGDPTVEWTTEPFDNGGRVNVGVFGGTVEASLSDTNSPEFLPISLRDGGIAPDGQWLHWLYRGINPTNAVRIEYSADGGRTWIEIASGIRADSSPFQWLSTDEPSPECLWRISLASNTNIVGSTEVFFTHLTRPLTYYVNDSSTNFDIYCTAVGSPTNSGYSSNSPLHSIQAVLTKFQLNGGDGIKVDTGEYTMTNTVKLDVNNSGLTNSRVYIMGSTNLAVGGSWLRSAPDSAAPAFLFYKARDIAVSLFRLSGFTNAFSLQEESSGCVFSDLDIQGTKGPAVLMTKATAIQLDRVLIREGQSHGLSAVNAKFAMDGCVVWSNQGSALYLGEAVEAGITNSVLQASGLGRYCYLSPTTTTIRADYNDLYVQNGAQIGSINGLQFEKLPQWVREMAQDRYSLSTDPMFHDPANGDFHPRSVAGRYHPVYGWTNDVPEEVRRRRGADPCEGMNPELVPESTDYSPLIDMGSPRTAWSNEPPPNGGRRNIGLHGNTWQASKSNTNQWLRAVTAMSGGIVYGGVNLTWGVGSAVATNAMARLEYSFNNGLDWVRIAEATVGAREYFWQSDLRQAGIEIWPTSPGARWRIYLLDDPNVVDMTDTYFGLRNSPFRYYLNDTSRVNDVYTDAIGNDCNMGFYPAAPKLTLNALLEDVDLEPTDMVFIDTGVYLMSEPNPPWMTDTNSPIRWEASDGGREGELVLVNGSTHPDGSLFLTTNRFATGGFFFMGADYVELNHLRFSGESLSFAGRGLTVSNLHMTNGFNPIVALSLRADASVFQDLRVDRANVTLSGNGNRVDRMHQRWGETAIVGTNVTMLRSSIFTTSHLKTGVVVNANGVVISNCTVVSTNGSALSKHGFGSLRLGHNILVAGGSETNSVIEWHDGPLVSDWNNLLARGSAWVGRRNGKWERLAYWQAASGQDANSVSFEPLFQNESAGDLHLNSKVGRWSPVFNDWDVDADHSPLIDLGDPWVGTALEPMPNGYRRNLGAYGGTVQASMSLSNLWLTALTQNDGGVLKGTNVVLRWAAGNAGGRTVRLQYFDGTDWITIATGISATDGYYVWNTTGFPDSFSARWRVEEEGATGEPVSDQTDKPFSLRNHEQAFYVNDDDRTGDIYCNTNGAGGNDGLTPDTPKLTLQAILDTYDLEGGDIVYLDTGGYPSATDIRIIWSRSGSTNADVIIQGNTNGAHTVLTRTGAPGFPAVGIDVKASRIRLSDLAVQGVNRAILLESNLNATVHGVVVKNAGTGVTAEGAMGTIVENSAFWNTEWGVNLVNARTSVLENLTFVASTLAGIRLSGTQIDTMRNNIFIPAVGAYAYSIGAATSLLANATMDYNLYDFSAAGAGFFEGSPYPNEIRRWQVGGKAGEYGGMYKDFRSAITNAHLAEIQFEPLDFHPKSEYGRWTESGWTTDTNTSWAVDHGNPYGDYSREPTNNGGRVNVGMYGNTEQASQGSTNIFYEVRTLNNGEVIDQDDTVWPLVWFAHLLGNAEWVSIQFSADNGASWVELTNMSAFVEYYVWTVNLQYQTPGQGRWRVIGIDAPYRGDISDLPPFTIRWFKLGFITAPQPIYGNGLQRMDWRGGVPGMRYSIEYSDDFGQTWVTWEEKYNGPAPINRSNFVIPSGEAQLRYTFEDRTAYMRRTRWYRIKEFAE